MAAAAPYDVKPGQAVDDPSLTNIQDLADNMSESDKEAFLASFSSAEDKAIMRKVDRRFLLLIGLMYLIKNVGYLLGTWFFKLIVSRSTMRMRHPSKSYSLSSHPTS